jgi:hypothetical protein
VAGMVELDRTLILQIRIGTMAGMLWLDRTLILQVFE